MAQMASMRVGMGLEDALVTGSGSKRKRRTIVQEIVFPLGTCKLVHLLSQSLTHADYVNYQWTISHVFG